MLAMMKKRHAVKRAARKAAQDAYDALAYTPPPRDGNPGEVAVKLLVSGTPVTITVRRWKGDHGGVVEIEADATIPAAGATDDADRLLVATLDCRHHGTIHMHNDLKDPDHDMRDDIIAVTDARDLVTYYERALREFATYARRAYQAGGTR